MTENILEGVIPELISTEIALIIDDSQKSDQDQSSHNTQKNDPEVDILDDSDFLLRAPTIPADLYDLLPKILKTGSEMFQTDRERDVFLTSALTILSGCFPSIYGIYDKKKVYANLFSFVIAPAASGKGSLTYSRDMAQEIHNKLTSQTAEGADILYSTSAAVTSLRMLYIPGNISAAALISLLNENGGIGIICETEADSMSNSLKQDWGSFSDLLRKSFHHETVSYARKKNNEFMEINKPRLSVCLSGTPDQVGALIKSISDGLFSRFIFYTFRNTPVWKDVSPDKSIPVYDTYIRSIQLNIRNVYEFYNEMEYSFDLTLIQWKKLNDQYEKILRDSVTFIGSDTSSIVMRLALIQFRIAMILSIFRNFEKGIAGNTIDCDDIDYGISEALCDVYLQHAILVYKIMTKQLSSGMAGNIKKFLKALPIIPFRRKVAVEIGKKINISERSVSSYLKTLIENKFLIQDKPQGTYQQASC